MSFSAVTYPMRVFKVAAFLILPPSSYMGGSGSDIITSKLKFTKSYGTPARTIEEDGSAHGDTGL